MTIANHPLHGSGRAALPHPALALGRDGEAHARIGMPDTWGRKPAGDVGTHAAPRQMVALTPTTQDAPPELRHRCPKRVQGGTVQRNTVVPVVPEDDRPQICALLRNGLMQALPEFGFHRLQLRLQPRAYRLTQHREPPLPGLRTAMCETQKVEGLRLPVAPRSSVRIGKATEFEETRLVGMQRQPEPRESVSPNRAKRSRSSARKRSASPRCWNPTTKSSAKRTTTTSPCACVVLHRWTQRSKT